MLWKLYIIWKAITWKCFRNVTSFISIYLFYSRTPYSKLSPWSRDSPNYLVFGPNGLSVKSNYKLTYSSKEQTTSTTASTSTTSTSTTSTSTTCSSNGSVKYQVELGLVFIFTLLMLYLSMIVFPMSLAWAEQTVIQYYRVFQIKVCYLKVLLTSYLVCFNHVSTYQKNCIKNESR